MKDKKSKPEKPIKLKKTDEYKEAESSGSKEHQKMKSEEHRPKEKNGLKVINGNFGRNKSNLGDLLKGSVPPNVEPSEKEILMKVRKILDSIEVYEKEWTGGRRKKRSTIKTRIFGGRIPTALINEIHEFPGSNTWHMERALKLYVKVMRAGDGDK